MRVFHSFFILIFLFSSTLIASPVKEKGISSFRMLSDLEFIKNAFDVKYAPRLWKHQFCKWDLEKEYQSAKEALLKEKVTLKEFQRTLKRFFLSTKDYHAGIVFYSTESATLPFTIKGSRGRYFVVHVDRDNLGGILQSLLHPQIEEGDELLTFDGLPIQQVISALMEEEGGGNTLETDLSYAELILTNRSGMRGEIIPQGDVEIEVKKPSGESVSYTYTWNYIPEKMTEPMNPPMKMELALPSFQKESIVKSLTQNDLMNKMFLSPLAMTFKEDARLDHKYQIGGRESYVPKLGKKVWESEEGCAFDAYIFTMPSSSPLAQKKIGYIRIPHYSAGEDEAEEFAEILSQFQWKTEALVIDQINNPGGSAFYLYALASMLTDRPLIAPKHHFTLTQSEVYMAHKFLETLSDVVDDKGAQEIFGQTVAGYPVDLNYADKFKEFCQFMVEEWKKGNLYTGVTHLFGVDEILPHPKARYTKPILVLTNSLDFSAADFFAAIMQDNNRATILGTRTAGAGGAVNVTTFPNRSGIALFSMTGSLAERVNRKPIENLGVTPDLFYECTPEDLQGHYEGYQKAILKGVETILKKV